MELDLENPLCLCSSHSHHYSSLFHIESAPAPAPDLFFRRKCISLISLYNNNNSNPFLTYLAINYLDRFLCLQNTQDWKPWTVSLVAVSCLSLALKMTGTESSSGANPFQVEEDGESMIAFDRKTIQRMEMVILGALKWRMRSITPFSFISFFISLFNLEHPSSSLPTLLRARAAQIIFKSQNEVSLMGCKPSIMAASSLLVASHELFPLHLPCFRESICQSSYVDKDNLMDCYGAMQEAENGGDGSPVHMFDRRVWSTSSSETEEVGASAAVGGGEE